MSELAHRRHDISNKVWKKLEPPLPDKKGNWGGIAQDTRRFINAMFRIMRTGAPWRVLPPHRPWLAPQKKTAPAPGGGR